MNNFESANWPHIVKKEKNMLGRVYLYVEEMINRKYPQPRKGGLEEHIEVAKEKRLSERYIRGNLADAFGVLRSLKDKVRNKIELKSKVPQYLSGLRKKKRNGK
tara:strand:+ start:1355 stop:1666 length:312 start_codon:yes stop_codon:yes gene_type:complete